MHPSRIGGYEVTGELGRGGMGAVYSGRDPHDGRPVAIELLVAARGGDESRRRRFAREAEALSRLRHPGVVPVLAVGEEQGCPYLVLGDTERGLSVADQVAARATEAIAAVPQEARGEPLGGRVFFPVQALFACSRAARRLGDHARADRWLDAGLSTTAELDGLDQVEALVDALSTAGEVEGEARWAVARKVLAACRSAHAGAQPWELRDLFAAAARIVQ